MVFKNRHNRKLLYVHYRCGGSIGIAPISREFKIHLTNFDGILATLGLFVDFKKGKAKMPYLKRVKFMRTQVLRKE